MKIYWTINQIPELAGLTPDQSKEAWQFCFKKYAFKHWEVWVSLFAVGLLYTLGSNAFRGIIGGAIGAGIGGGIFGVTATNVLRPHLRDYVSSHFSTANPSTETFSED
ncbi:MAG: hypothetical protein WCP16_21655 [Pseudanabaena sp. ELA645]|jgi:hypothetical protein